MYYKNIGNMDVYMYGTVWIVILVRKIYSSYFYITNHLRVCTDKDDTCVYLRTINYACISDTSQVNAFALIVYTSENCADGIAAAMG